MTKNLNVFNPVKLNFGYSSYIIDADKKIIHCELPVKVLIRDPNCSVEDVLITKVDRYFIIKSTAKCSDSDFFSEEKGKRIAYEKARKMAYKRVYRNFKSIVQEYDAYIKMFNFAAEKYSTAAKLEERRIQNLDKNIN